MIGTCRRVIWAGLLSLPASDRGWPCGRWPCASVGRCCWGLCWACYWRVPGGCGFAQIPTCRQACGCIGVGLVVSVVAHKGAPVLTSGVCCVTRCRQAGAREQAVGLCQGCRLRKTLVSVVLVVWRGVCWSSWCWAWAWVGLGVDRGSLVKRPRRSAPGSSTGRICTCYF